MVVCGKGRDYRDGASDNKVIKGPLARDNSFWSEFLNQSQWLLYVKSITFQ
jgi:hypothetical protein